MCYCYFFLLFFFAEGLAFDFFAGVFAFVIGFFLGVAFPLGEDVFAGAGFLPFGEDATVGLFFAGFSSSISTNFSTVQATLMETTSSPGFTSTTASPFVAARFRRAASSNLVDFGAPLLRWMVAM